MSSTIEARMTVSRAAIASSIAQRIEAPVAGAVLDRTSDLSDRRFFTISSAMPAGYHMETELLPLEAIMRDVEVVVRSDENGDDDDRSMTAADHRLEEINAFVHDRLLNPILPVRAETPSITALRPINEVYGETLRHASFAGNISATTSRYEEANALLFADGAPTEALETYRQYESDVQDARAALNELDGSESSQVREDAQNRLDRLEAEWIGIGRKQEIEEAFRILQEESDAAGHEGERTRLLERFQAGEKARIDAAGLSCYRVNLVPISPLFSDEAGPQWQQVELDGDAVQQSVTAPIQVALDISNEDIEEGVADLRTLTCEFVQCDIVRDWLDTDFFSARYWRLDSEEDPLSDGQGGGRLPAFPETVIFIRNARAIYEGETTVVFGDDAEEDTAAREEMASIQVVQVSEDEEDAEEEDDEPALIEAARSAGLSSSLNLLNRESERVSQARRSRVMAVQQDRLTPRRSSNDDEDDDDGGGGGFLSRAMNTISDAIAASTTDVKPQALRSSQNSSREQTMSIRPSARAREATSERRARRSRASVRVRDHRDSSRFSSSGGSRRSRRRHSSRGNVMVRDHRDSSRSRSSSRTRRRDHRNRDDDRKHTRVPARRGRSARRRSITLEGRIETSQAHADRLSGIEVAMIKSESDDRETSIGPKRSSDSRLTFSETIRDRSGDDELWLEFILRDNEGDELDRQVVMPDEDEETVELHWTVGAEALSIELAGKLTPTLHGYQIRVLAPSPDPDDGLDWE